MTERERATVFDAATGARYRDPVEPLTNYFVGRMKHTSADGNTTIGALGTAANRRLDAPVFDELPTTAYVGGMDFFHRWGRNTYTLAASVGGSISALVRAMISAASARSASGMWGSACSRTLARESVM